MAENIRAFLFVIAVVVPAFVLAGQAFGEDVISRAKLTGLRWAWTLITAAVFLTSSFWVYVVAAFLVLSVARKKMGDPLALYAVLLCAAPPIEAVVPGLLGIESLFYLTHARILALALLIPKALELSRAKRHAPWTAAEWLVAAYVCWIFIKLFAAMPMSQALRYCVHTVLDVVLPYFVYSRSRMNIRDLSEVMIAMLLAGFSASAIGMFETSRHWLLYANVTRTWVPESELATAYLLRGDTLRAVTSLGHSLALGFFLMMCVPLLAGFYKDLRANWSKRLLALLLGGGVLATLSRGPWVGALIGAGVSAFTHVGARKRILRAIASLPFLVAAISLLPADHIILRSLPFLGSVDLENVAYREKLAQVAWAVLDENFWTGDFFYLSNPQMQQMRQGQGLIDIVNYYVGVALPLGVIGLLLFLLILISSLIAVVRTRLSARNPHEIQLGNILAACIVATAITLVGVSEFGAIQQLIWLVLGLAATYSRRVEDV